MVRLNGLLASGLLAAILAGCGTTSGDGGGFTDFFSFGGSKIAESGARVVTDVDPSPDTYCPRVEVMEGGAAISISGRSSESALTRSQAVLRRFARECLLMPNGTVTVKVGVMGLVLVGAGGRAGTYNVPVRIVLKDGDTVLAQRVKSVPTTVSSETSQGEFQLVEEDLTIPAAHVNSFEIVVGLGGAPGGRRGR